MTASFRATATLALRSPLRLATLTPQDFECRPFCYTGEQHIGCLVEVTSQHFIAAFRDPTRPVDLAGCEPSRRQSDIGSNASRSSEWGRRSWQGSKEP